MGDDTDAKPPTVLDLDAILAAHGADVVARTQELLQGALERAAWLENVVKSAQQMRDSMGATQLLTDALAAVGRTAAMGQRINQQLSAAASPALAVTRQIMALQRVAVLDADKWPHVWTAIDTFQPLNTAIRRIIDSFQPIALNWARWLEEAQKLRELAELRAERREIAHFLAAMMIDGDAPILAALAHDEMLWDARAMADIHKRREEPRMIRADMQTGAEILTKYGAEWYMPPQPIRPPSGRKTIPAYDRGAELIRGGHSYKTAFDALINEGMITLEGTTALERGNSYAAQLGKFREAHKKRMQRSEFS